MKEISLVAVCVSLVIDGLMSIAFLAYSAFLVSLGTQITIGLGVILFIYVAVFKSNLTGTLTSIFNK